MLPFSRILIVDDSRVSRLIVRGMLERAGFSNLDEAVDGRDALALLNRRSFALVLSDWNMAPMSGLELLTAMRASPGLAALPFVMVTARSQKRFSDVARDRGATRYLEKPFSAETLIACVRSVGRDARLTA